VSLVLFLAAIAFFLVWIAKSVLSELIGQEVKGSIPGWSAALARSAARRLPPELQGTYEEAWLGELAMVRDKPLSSLRFAFGLRRAAKGIAKVESAGQGEQLERVNRVLDAIFALTTLILLAPVIDLLAIAGFLSGGRAFFRRLRIGKGGREFYLLQFNPVGRATADGQREITRFGHALHRTNVNQLPEFVNVLRGEMALIGPPPVIPWKDDAQGDSDLKVRPGILSWELLVKAGHAEITLDEARQRDRARTPMNDLRLIARSFGAQSVDPYFPEF
jgi:lipopolysaccharide/colanic/teichoic acid biosynthesis glycosyltransferase